MPSEPMRAWGLPKSGASSAIIAALLAANPASAQNEGDDGDSGQIIVTATKRAENLQSVPISVTAIGGNVLERARVTNVDDLLTKVVNLQLNSVVGDNTPIFAMRGVSMSDYSLNQSSPIATYYDEVYKSNFALLGVSMFDLERVEVMRGPQGTLYGKNTTGGAVNLIARKARLGETGGDFSAGYGNYGRIDINGAANVPFGEKVAVRVAGTFARADGWFKNIVPSKADLASVREWALRGTIYAEPSDGLRLTLRASTSKQTPRNYGIHAQPEAINRAGLDKWEIAANIDERRLAKTWSVALTADLDVADWLTLTSITSYDDGVLWFHEDTDGTATKTLEIPYFDDASQFAQDLRFTSDTGNPFDFILGIYFNREKVLNATTLEISQDVDSDGVPGITADDCATGLPLACLFSNRFAQTKKSFAIYSDVKYAFTDALTLRGGLRYTHDRGLQSDFEANVFGVDATLIANLIPLSELRYKTENLSSKIGLDYKFANGNLLYAHVSRDYRAPSFNAQAFFDPSELSVAKPEAVTAYEAGAKLGVAGSATTLNFAAFYYDYRNQQFLNVDPTNAAQTLLNIDKSRIYGGEAELSLRASDMLSLRGGLGMLSSQIVRGSVSGVNVEGNRLSNAPRLTFNLGADLTLLDTDTGRLSLHPNVAYQSNQFFEVLNISRLRQPGYAIVEGHLDFETSDGRWNASIWGKNLTNKYYFTSRIDLLAGFGLDYNHVGRPRTYGLTLGVRF
ncbi:iron complex outermembrane receptor protein [Novosphingobium hassiacum]|uniref:Iron complex outermembrane receptor protein n=1 Tax=Novosphingobium hassiacum TaxID=173676 RepID=A0A7W5ZZ56_9SPHN|nr:TonB-dependent receptor [Novosphingobium hassiacum]MBB3862735.1 iron complex outermembrane receptor protein [Novosphingobium hassiacum]